MSPDQKATATTITELEALLTTAQADNSHLAFKLDEANARIAKLEALLLTLEELPAKSSPMTIEYCRDTDVKTFIDALRMNYDPNPLSQSVTRANEMVQKDTPAAFDTGVVSAYSTRPIA